MKTLIYLLAITCMITGCSKQPPPKPQVTQPYFEGFEAYQVPEAPPSTVKWRGEVKIDNEVKRTGNSSLRMTTKTKREPNVFYYLSFKHGKAGKKLTFWAKGKDNSCFWVSTERSWNARVYVDMLTSDWKQYEATCLEDTLYIVSEGAGTVWVDDIRIQ